MLWRVKARDGWNEKGRHDLLPGGCFAPDWGWSCKSQNCPGSGSANPHRAAMRVVMGSGDGGFITVAQPWQCLCSLLHILCAICIPSHQVREQRKGKYSCWDEGCKQGCSNKWSLLHPPAVCTAGLASSREPGQGSGQLFARNCETPSASHQQILNKISLTAALTARRKAAQYLMTLVNLYPASQIQAIYGDQRGGCYEGKASFSLTFLDNAAEERQGHRFQCRVCVHLGCYEWPCPDTIISIRQSICLTRTTTGTIWLLHFGTKPPRGTTPKWLLPLKGTDVVWSAQTFWFF